MKKIVLLSTTNAPLLGYYAEGLLNDGIDIAAIVFDSKDFSEKDARIFQDRTHGKLPPIPLRKFLHAGLETFFVDSHNSETAVQIFKNIGCDILVNAGTPRILKRSVIEAANIGVLNCHPGILPDYRGCTCVEWAVFNNDPVGNTIHFMNDKIDEGPVVLSETVPLSVFESYTDLRIQVYRSGIALLGKAIKKIQRENLRPETLPLQSGGKYYPPIDGEKLRAVKEKIASGSFR